MRNSIQLAYKNNIKIKLYNYNANERIYKLLGDNTNINRVVKRVINFLHWRISRQQIMVISLKWNDIKWMKYILQGFSKITFDYEIEETLGEEAII